MRTERGAITIHVAIALTAMLAFGAMVIDHGVFMVARTQAQNAADAGAAAGAMTLLKDATAYTEARMVAEKVAGDLHQVWGETTAGTNINSPGGSDDCNLDLGFAWGIGCIRLEVFRGLDAQGNQLSNAIPTYMMRMFGNSSQGVRALAMGQVTTGNTARCVKPLALADWPSGLPFLPTDTFDTGASIWPGFRSEDPIGPTPGPYDVGAPVVLSPRNTLAVDFESGPMDISDFTDCLDATRLVGLYANDVLNGVPCQSPGDASDPEHGCLRVKPFPTSPPGSLIASTVYQRDNSGVNWVGRHIVGSCIDDDPPCVNPNHVEYSRAVIPIVLFNPQVYSNQNGEGFPNDGTPGAPVGSCGSANCVVQVTNIVGLLVEGSCTTVAAPPTICATITDPPNAIVGKLVPYPGEGHLDPHMGKIEQKQTFVRFTRLIQ